MQKLCSMFALGSSLLVAGCSKAPTPTPMTKVQDTTDKISFKGPAGWTEGREANSFTLREPSGMSVLTLSSLPKSSMDLEALFKQSWSGMIALTGDAGSKPAEVKLANLPGLQAQAEGKLEGHPVTVMTAVLETPDRFICFQGILADRDQPTRLQILNDSASSIELIP